MMRLYATIEKVAKRQDNTVDVVGFASSESLDSAGEIITANAMRNALPDYMKFANVREMHDATKAAGTATDAAVQADGKTYFAVHVVDPIAVLKVENGVYKGFSIAGRVLERQGNKITQLQLIEVSLVDRPANPDAVFTCYKCDDSEKAPKEDLPEALAKGADATLKATTLEGLTVDSEKTDQLPLSEPVNEKAQAIEGSAQKQATDATLLKRFGQIEALLVATQKAIEAQNARLIALESVPNPTKSILKVVAKEADSLPEATKSLPSNPHEAILKAHRLGGFRIA